MTAEDLQQTARQLAQLFNELAELKYAPTRAPNVRVQKPTFTSMDPTPDHGWAFSHEYELMHETTDDRIPGGLRTMAIDALSYTTARRHRARTYDASGYLDDDVTPGVLCAFLARHAQEITDHFPAAEDLLELLGDQKAYLARQLQQRYGGQTLKPMRVDTLATGYGTAADLAPMVSAVVGRVIDREKIRYWGRSGRIEAHLTASGTTYYHLAEVISEAQTYVDKRVTR